jgi:hypothetical protein
MGTTTVYNGYEVDTTECDKRHCAATVPEEGVFERFLAWLANQDVELVLGDYLERHLHEGYRPREVPVADRMLRRIADEVAEGRTALTSEDLGAIVDAWGEEGMDRCRWLGLRCPYPRQTEWDDVWRTHNVVTLPAGWYQDGRSIERLLADFYGIDLRKLDREQAAILVAYRAPKKESAA